MRTGPRLPHRFRCLALALAGALPLLAQVTETPVTMEPGSALLRVDALTFGIKPDESAPNQYKAVGAGWALLSAGITSTVDAEIGAQAFVHDTYQYQGVNQTHSGIGDLSLRAKWTFWSDPYLEQSAAVIPYVRIPTNSGGVSNGSLEGGIIVPWQMTIAEGLRGGAMVELDQLRNEADTRYDTRLYASGVLQAQLGSMVSGYGEATFSASSAGTSASWGMLSAGATLAVSKNFAWDFEVGRVIGHSATAWQETLRFRWKLF